MIYALVNVVKLTKTVALKVTNSKIWTTFICYILLYGEQRLRKTFKLLLTSPKHILLFVYCEMSNISLGWFDFYNLLRTWGFCIEWVKICFNWNDFTFILFNILENLAEILHQQASQLSSLGYMGSRSFKGNEVPSEETEQKEEKKDGVVIEKSNILMVGPTGSGRQIQANSSF